jgi:S1-C subfamily serine protease
MMPRRYNNHMTVLSVFFFLIFSSTSVLGAEGIALYDQLRNSVVTIQGLTPTRPSERRIGMLSTSGAGVILDKNGVIATNTHVIYGATYIQVILKTGEKLNATVLYIAPNEDIALLQVMPPHPLTPIVWADSNLVQLNDEVITLGHSELLKSTISGGHIRAIGVKKDDPAQIPEFLELDINHYQGDSGGPVFTRQGEFLGLMNAKRTNENRACLVVPSNKAHFAYINLANPSQKR